MKYLPKYIFEDPTHLENFSKVEYEILNFISESEIEDCFYYSAGHYCFGYYPEEYEKFVLKIYKKNGWDKYVFTREKWEVLQKIQEIIS